jgi:outer membrane protein assembly factor BamB
MFLIAAIAVAICYAVQMPLRAGVAMILGLLVLLLIVLWMVFRSPMSWKSRLLVFAGFVGLAFAVKASVKVDGSLDGTSMPKLIWKWTPRAGEGLAALPETGVIAPVPQSMTVAHADVLQFLGDDARSGVFADTGIATDWEKNPPKELWRIPVGLGWGGFSVMGNFAVTQEQRDDEELVTCYDLGSGSFLWAHRNKVRFTEGMGGDGPRSTPTIDAATGLVYAMGGTGILDCLELATGKLVWTKDVLGELGRGNPMYGKANGPLLVGELVVVSGGKGAPTLVAYQKADGAAGWKGGESGASYSSPALLDVNGESQIVSVNADNVTGHELGTGAVIWSYPWEAKWPKSAQPRSVGDGRILVTASYGMGTHLFQVKGSEVETLWDTVRMKTKFSSVCVKGGHAYGLDEGVFSCIEIETGERIWKDGRYGFGQNILVGDALLVLSEQGEVILVEATPEEHRELAKISVMDSKTWNTPTLAAPYLLVRNDREAVCLLLAK